ncbi:MAG TPA: peptidase, partial [Desulfotomaculum sp.]|nr:peptidase [Desulfotomaculum sp.]
AWTSRGSNKDFKPSKRYQISEAGNLLPITQVGEFPFDEMSDQGVSTSLATFGLSWSFTRQALINDDLGMLVRMPQAYARAAARGINKLVYKQLGENATVYDNKALFHEDHGNLAGSGGAINTKNVGAGKAAMRKQRGLRGLEALNITPAFLIIPSYLETYAQQFLRSIADPAGAHSGVANVFENALTPVVEPELDDYGLTAWYLAAAPEGIDTVEVCYLDGKDLPTIESETSFERLGIKWRIFIDYGVTVIDFRGLYKSPDII